jgi:hypothetical protein
VNDRDVIFDRRGELPTATLVPRERGARVQALLGELRGWLAGRWSWLRPRTLPMLVATASMFAVLQSADYLAHHGQPPVARHVIVRVAPCKVLLHRIAQHRRMAVRT